MGTEVLRAQDPLQRMRVIGHGAPVLSPIQRNRSNYQNPNHRKHEPQQQQHKKRENMISSKSSSFVDDCVVVKKNSLVMGGFTLLKRGESIDESVKKKMDEFLVVEPKEKIESVGVDTKPKKKKIEKKKNGSNSDLIVFGGTKRLDPQMVSKHVKVSDLISSSPPLLSSNGVSNKSGHMYAGSGFVQSPEPDSLPLPSFSLPSFNIRKKKGFVVDDTVSVSATKDIRRMLGLDGVLV